MGTDIAVVIGNYQGEQLLPDCLSSLTTQTQAPAEVIVVDAGSTDASVAVARAHDARVLEVENRGLGFLYNRGVEASATDYVLLLNNDVALDPDCVALLVAELDRDREIFAADPRQVSWDRTRLVHARTTLRRGGRLHHLLPGFVLDLQEETDQVAPTVCANGGAMMVRRSVFTELGGFDETFFLDFEDLDLGWRGWLAGWGSVHVPAAVVRHRVGAATGDDVAKRRMVSAHHNLMRFALKCLPARAAFRVIWTELVRIGIHPALVLPAFGMIAQELLEIIRLRRRLEPAAAFLEWALAGMPAQDPRRPSRLR